MLLPVRGRGVVHRRGGAVHACCYGRVRPHRGRFAIIRRSVAGQGAVLDVPGGGGVTAARALRRGARAGPARGRRGTILAAPGQAEQALVGGQVDAGQVLAGGPDAVGDVLAAVGQDVEHPLGHPVGHVPGLAAAA